MPLSFSIPTESVAEVSPPRFGGVEVNSNSIRAGIFTPGLQILGKIKISAKPERGTASTLQRIARCLRYAADEADLDIARIQSVAVGVSGQIESQEGLVRHAPELGWRDLPLRAELEQLLSIPVRVANVENLSALAVHTMELRSAPGKLAVVFIRPCVSLALLQSGQWLELSELPIATAMEEPEANLFRTLHHPDFVPFRSRDFRSAIRQGRPCAVEFLGRMAEAARELAVQTATDFQPDIVALAGNLAEELSRDILHSFQESLRAACAGRPEPVVMISRLGNLSSLAGGAAFASQHRSVPPLAAISSPAIAK